VCVKAFYFNDGFKYKFFIAGIRFSSIITNSVLSPNLEGIVMTTASARHILVATEEECLALKDRINAGEEFGQIAMEYSSCPSKAQGGDLGEFGPGMMVKEFDEAVFDGPVSVVQGPVKTQFGYHLLEVMSRG